MMLVQEGMLEILHNFSTG